MLFLSILFVAVLLILGFALSSDKGKNTIHARRHAQAAEISKLSKETRSGSVQVN